MHKHLSDLIQLLRNPWGVIMLTSLALAFVGLGYELLKYNRGERAKSIRDLWRHPLGKATLTLLVLSIVLKVIMAGLILFDFQPANIWFRSMGTIVTISFLFSMFLIGTKLRIKWGTAPTPAVYAVLILTLYSITITFIPQYTNMVQDVVLIDGTP